MSYKSHIELLRHIYDECEFISTNISSDTLKNDFLINETLKRAVVRSLEIIGEASKKIPADIKYNTPEVEWKSMAGMRDRLIHDYMGINYSIVWDVVKNKIPELKVQIKQVIDKEQI